MCFRIRECDGPESKMSLGIETKILNYSWNIGVIGMCQSGFLSFCLGMLQKFLSFYKTLDLYLEKRDINSPSIRGLGLYEQVNIYGAIVMCLSSTFE